MQGELRQNRVKLSVFRVLAEAASPMGVNELALSAGVNYQSLATRLPLLTCWHYLKRSVGFNYQGRPCFTYTLAAKGRRWLEKHNGDFGDELVATRYIGLRDGSRLYKGTPEYEAFCVRLRAKRPAKILRWYEFNSKVWVELRLEGGRLYFTDLPNKPR